MLKSEHMKNQKSTLLFFITLLAVAVQAQQKQVIQKVNFSGEWKAQESISMGGNIVCSYDEGDRMLSKTMKIVEHTDFLIIEVPNEASEAPLSSNWEKLTFDGKESKIEHANERGKKFTVNLSADRRTMTVNSIVHLTTANPDRNHLQEPMLVYVTEVWKLSNDGKTITIQAHAKSSLLGEERSWKTVFSKVG